MKVHRRRPMKVVTGLGLVVLVASIATGSAANVQRPTRSANLPAADASVPASTCAFDSGSNTRTCELWAKPGSIDLPNLTGVPIWGYAAAEADAATLPGPAIVANQGEHVVINLHNRLANGQATSLSVPNARDLPPDEAGAADGADATYQFDAVDAGTSLYQAGPTQNYAKQVAMGLYGAFIVRPDGAPLRAYPDAATDFDVEQVLVASEIDPRLNGAPDSFDMSRYAPTYWLFNGRAYPDTDMLQAPAGSRLLARWVNAGLENVSFGLIGLHQTIVGVGGHRLGIRAAGSGAGDPPSSNAYSVVAETIPAGSSLDALVDVPLTAGTMIPFVSASGHIDNAGHNTGGTVDIGGQVAMLTTTDGLFADSFEFGSTVAWNGEQGAGLRVITSTATDGTMSLQARLSGTRKGAVVDRLPSRLSTYRARFYFNPAGAITDGNVTILAGRSAGGATLFRAQDRRTSSGGHQVRIVMRYAGRQHASRWIAITRRWHAIELVWTNGSNGKTRLWVDGRLRATLRGGAGATTAAKILLGPSAGQGRDARGRLLFDDFASTRRSRIGL